MVCNNSIEVMREVQIGRAGELMVCGIIESFGYKTILCQQQAFDALIISDDRFYRLEIKSSRSPNISRDRYEFTTSIGSRRKMPLSHKNADILCVIALDIRKCYFVAVHNHRSVKLNVRSANMLNCNEPESLAIAMARVDERRENELG